MDYYDDELTVYALLRDVFTVAATTCFLWGLHRLARGVVLRGRVSAYKEFSEAYTPEEREYLIHRIKAESLHS